MEVRLEVESIPEPLYVGQLLSMRGVYAQVLFHLNIHNRSGAALRLTRLSLAAERRGQLLERLTLEEPSLALRLRAVPWIVVRERQTLAAAHRWRGALGRAKGNTRLEPGESVALLGQLSLRRVAEQPEQILCAVEHSAGRSEHRFAVRTFEQRTRLRIPVDGKWWVMAGHRFDEDHSGALISSQNFAYDLGVLGDGAQTFSADPRHNASYLANGRPVRAAADGEVVVVQDGVAENEPVGVRPSWDQLLRRPYDLAGNFVVLRHDEREHTAYLHLRPGVVVRRGQRVRAGEVLGRCGNSGNSLETHLHVQLQDGPDVMRASGLPARFGDFTIHLGHLRLYVPPDRPMPLPGRLIVEPGRSAGAAEIPKSFEPAW